MSDKEEDAIAVASDEETPEKVETVGQMQQRHKREVKELQAKCESQLHKIPKSDKAAKKKAQGRHGNLQADQKKKHKAELEAKQSGSVEGQSSVVSAISAMTVGVAAAAAKAAASAEGSQDVAQVGLIQQRGLGKAQKKKLAKQEAERAARERIEEEKSNVVSDTKIENDRFNAMLLPKGLRIKEVLPDGNCLYRSVADQLALQKSPLVKGVEDYGVVRRICASHMRAHKDDFLPFVALEAEDVDAFFDQYCTKIEHTHEWGGEPELLALATALNTKIIAHTSDSNPREWGEGDKPLHLSYHRKAYALGEHYNSVIPLPC